MSRRGVARARDRQRRQHQGFVVEQLVRAPGEVKDNFLAMVVPLLKARGDVGVKVLIKERLEKRSDIRVLVEDLRAVTSKEGKKVAQWRGTG